MSEPSRNDSLWLQLRVGESTRVFELSRTEERAIVVGSLLRADVRIDEPGIAPVHFHFERDGFLVHVVPAYGAVLRVDGLAIVRPHVIRGRAMLEFLSHRMEVVVLEHAPRSVAPKVSEPRGTATSQANLPALYGDDGDETTVALRPDNPLFAPHELKPALNKSVPLLDGHPIATAAHITSRAPFATTPPGDWQPCGTCSKLPAVLAPDVPVGAACALPAFGRHFGRGSDSGPPPLHRRSNAHRRRQALLGLAAALVAFAVTFAGLFAVRSWKAAREPHRSTSQVAPTGRVLLKAASPAGRGGSGAASTSR